MSNMEVNLRYWKQLAGVDMNFPKLAPLSDQEMKLVTVDDEKIKAIDQSVQSNPLTVVVIKPGWGATTLFKYMFDFYSTVGRRDIPVKIDLEFNSMPNPDDFAHMIKWQVASGFLKLDVEHVLEHRYVCEILGYDQMADGISFTNHVRRCRNTINDYEHNSEAFCKEYPFFDQPLVNILNHLLKNLRLQTIILYLFKRVVCEDDMSMFIKSLKEVLGEREILGNPNSFESAAKREIFFCTSSVLIDLDREFNQPYQRYNYRCYAEAEIHKMIVTRYSQQGRGTNLDVVFSTKFVERAYNEKKTINEIITEVENLIQEAVNCEQKDIPYQLTPVNKGASAYANQ